eukprot:TRINITY_DN3426_c0_g1_i1.p1 TRINITY_DN3426_c0_g1~~TRINITY_DN3426_c0_g1_i1.p1  ORF type:complete len:286 (+),score=47.13 TRINITY_DN3426_c0_g1_i1:128-985(+)
MEVNVQPFRNSLPEDTILEENVTCNVVYPQGVGWRKSPNYDDKITEIPGPSPPCALTGCRVQGDVHYLRVVMPPGSNYIVQYLPFQNPAGTLEILRQTSVQPQTQMAAPPPLPPPSNMTQNGMQSRLNQDIAMVQTAYQQQAPPMSSQIQYVQAPTAPVSQQQAPPMSSQIQYVQGPTAPVSQQQQTVRQTTVYTQQQQVYAPQPGYVGQPGYSQYGQSGGTVIVGLGKKSMKKMKKHGGRHGCHGGYVQQPQACMYQQQPGVYQQQVTYQQPGPGYPPQQRQYY